MVVLHRKNAMPAGRQAFTLIELLVVISIIAVISLLALPNFMGARDKAKDSARISDMGAIKNALRLYYNDKQSYPDALDSTMVPYMPSILNLGYTGYVYTKINNGDGFTLQLTLESSQGDSDTDSQTKCGVSPVVEGSFVVCAN